MLRSDLCDFSDVYIALKETIIIDGGNNQDIKKRSLTLKSNAPFISCIAKINNVLIDNAEDLDVVMPKYNLTEYSKNYRNTRGSLWDYYRDESNNPLLNNDKPPTVNYISLEILHHLNTKAILQEKHYIMITENDNRKKDKVVEIISPLKHLSNFWRILDMPLINCERNLIFKWSEKTVLTDIITHASVAAQRNNPAILAINAPTNATF